MVFSKYYTGSSAKNLGKHIKITAKSFRETDIFKANVIKIYKLSPTVNGFMLRILDEDFKFYPGQWVDVFIPNMQTVGGFSLCSTPKLYKEKKVIELGVKKSEWSPSKWFHEKCTEGTEIALRVGGDFFYPKQIEDLQKDVLLIGGGVGVNPVYSIFSHLCENKLKTDKRVNTFKGRASFLFSAKCETELLYRLRIDELAENLKNRVYVQYFTTKFRSKDDRIHNWRICERDIRFGLDHLDIANTLAYVCGPPLMIEDVEKHLLRNGVSEHNIFSEKWW